MEKLRAHQRGTKHTSDNREVLLGRGTNHLEPTLLTLASRCECVSAAAAQVKPGPLREVR